ncbi:MAG: replicative DNA helicase, partial [SAR202 cluster bacterium]|nr:replicative DNA helicase [SAR202 cluster bacterium]
HEPTRKVFAACVALHKDGVRLDQVVVGQELARRGQLADLGGHAYLSSLIAALPTTVHAESYTNLVRSLSVLRDFVSTGAEIAAMGYGAGNLETEVARAEGLIAKLRDRTSRGNLTTIRILMDQFLSSIGKNTTSPSPLVQGIEPIPTGIGDMDLLLGGLQAGDLVIVAARPSVGKSALAVGIARNAAAQGAKIGIVSLEMSNEQVGHRLLAAETGLETHRLRLKLFSEAEEARVVQASGRLSGLVMFFEDTTNMTVRGIASWARRLHSQKKLDLLIVDYLQLVRGNTDRAEFRVQEVSQVSRDLKTLARHLQIPVLVCSQLNRQVETRTNHRPMLSDLRDSGSIEQDADVVMFIHREDMYITEEEWALRNPNSPYPKDTAEIIVAKHRNGPVGSLYLRFNGKLALFEELTKRP